MLLVPEDDEPVSREDINLIMLALMKLGATMEEIRDLLLESNGEDEEEPGP
jgi:NACalpha-BTF3-like transcription factor